MGLIVCICKLYLTFSGVDFHNAEKMLMRQFSDKRRKSLELTHYSKFALDDYWNKGSHDLGWGKLEDLYITLETSQKYR